jgi:hypothetical protein
MSRGLSFQERMSSKAAGCLALLSALSIPAAGLAQPSGTVERLFQDQQLREQLDNQRNQQSQPSQTLIEGAPSSQPKQPAEQEDTPKAPPIKGVDLEGARLFPPSELERLRQEWVGKPATDTALLAIQEVISDYYEKAKLLAMAGCCDGEQQPLAHSNRLGRGHRAHLNRDQPGSEARQARKRITETK